MASAFLSGFFFLFSHFSRILPIQSVESYSDKRDDKDLHSVVEDWLWLEYTFVWTEITGN